MKPQNVTFSRIIRHRFLLFIGPTCILYFIQFFYFDLHMHVARYLSVLSARLLLAYRAVEMGCKSPRSKVQILVFFNF